ncbi:MAG: hypothetical protein EKK64_06715 [Neisseriaceae bacterium]|nr:MAG: hypothetical protein EKK64_06715 [Neisseriaceae bacterium]
MYVVHRYNSLYTKNSGGLKEHWRKDLLCHRKYFFPAMTFHNGRKIYCTNGLFRETNAFHSILTSNLVLSVLEKKYKDEPTVVYKDGIKEWKDEQKGFHRTNGPAIMYPNGEEEYWVNGKRHRENGPAVIYPNGDCEYWDHGKRHRKNGPAVIIGNKQYWFKRGKFIKKV